MNLTKNTVQPVKPVNPPTQRLPFFQPKLTINQPNDIYEQEADHMADKVMRMADPAANQHSFFKPAKNAVQRKCQACEEQEKHVHRKESNSAEVHSSNELGSYVNSLSSSGQAMPESSRNFFEPRFGQDFSNVRLHTDSVAAKSAQSINALAYTSGNNIVFNSGQYSPESNSGKRLMAHELTHVVQQQSHSLNNTINRAALHTGRILNEGDCQHLACNSRWACDDESGVLCPAGTMHAGHKKRPLFTCDVNCDNNIQCGTNYMAIPNGRWRSIHHNCNQDLVVCANHSFAHATVRDRSEREAWELSPSLLTRLRAASDIRDGAIYPDENDTAFLADTRCRA
ncbi:hypothetical protein BH09BAC6_BH09BAC6_30930 [soil metagenome]|jgi:hypothetical protein